MDENNIYEAGVLERLEELTRRLETEKPGTEEYSRMIDDYLKCLRYQAERIDKTKELEKEKKEFIVNTIVSVIDIVSKIGAQIFTSVLGAKVLGGFIKMMFEFEETGAITSAGAKVVMRLLPKLKILS